MASCLCGTCDGFRNEPRRFFKSMYISGFDPRYWQVNAGVSIGNIGTVSRIENTYRTLWFITVSYTHLLVDSRGIECAGMWISSFPTLHDCAEGIGFHITTADDRTLSFATDLGCMTEQVYHNLAGSDFVVLESNHDRCV